MLVQLHCGSPENGERQPDRNDEDAEFGAEAAESEVVLGHSSPTLPGGAGGGQAVAAAPNYRRVYDGLGTVR